MTQNEKTPFRGANRPDTGQSQGLSRLTMWWLLRYFSAARQKKVGKVYRKLQVYSNVQNPTFLLLRRSFCAVGESCVINLIPDLKPDRTHPRPLSWSTNWSREVSCLQVKDIRVQPAMVHTIRLERGGAMAKRMETWT